MLFEGLDEAAADRLDAAFLRMSREGLNALFHWSGASRKMEMNCRGV
jgi:hypothetical protein